MTYTVSSGTLNPTQLKFVLSCSQLIWHNETNMQDDCYVINAKKTEN